MRLLKPNITPTNMELFSCAFYIGHPIFLKSTVLDCCFTDNFYSTNNEWLLVGQLGFFSSRISTKPSLLWTKFFLLRKTELVAMYWKKYATCKIYPPPGTTAIEWGSMFLIYKRDKTVFISWRENFVISKLMKRITF